MPLSFSYTIYSYFIIALLISLHTLTLILFPFPFILLTQSSSPSPLNTLFFNFSSSTLFSTNSYYFKRFNYIYHNINYI